MLNYMIFDYEDCMYNNIDPLIFLIRKDLFDNLRMAFFALSKEEQDFVKKAILLDRFDGHINYEEQMLRFKNLFISYYRKELL
ncbi:MAG TPA: hypothetical protein OIM63_03305 [Bacilli bacterium]|nr:hypothetical protein [Bacilli bacterium]